jgi:hypothetical protein
MSSLSVFLFANPSFINGVARLLDFQGSYTTYNMSRNRQEADVRALYADWLSVGHALGDAIAELAINQGVSK